MDLVHPRQARLHTLVVLGSVWLAALLAPPDAVSGGIQRLSVVLGDYRFLPAELEVVAGRPVQLRLTNSDTLTPHNFTLKDAAAGLDIDTGVSPGETKEIEFTPEKPGSFTFFCDRKRFLQNA